MHDICIIGGGYAGSAAALQLARMRVNVLILDQGLGRNRYSDKVHGVLGFDGARRVEIKRQVDAQLANYNTIIWMKQGAVAVSGSWDHFSVDCEDGQTISSRRLILCHGVVDLLPDIPGIQSCWGKSVLHCPQCHGDLLQGKQVAVAIARKEQLGVILALQRWQADLTVCLMDDVEDAEVITEATKIIRTPIVGIEHEFGLLKTLKFADGSSLDTQFLVLGTEQRLSVNFARQLGCTLTRTSTGEHIQVDHRWESTIPGLFAAGDAARAKRNINFALADGYAAGASAALSLGHTAQAPGVFDLIEP